MSPVVLAITGASGAIYGVRLLEVLLAAKRTVYLTISPSGVAVLKEELGLAINIEQFSQKDLFERRSHAPREERHRQMPASQSDSDTPPRQLAERDDSLVYCHHQDLMSPIASGSFLTAGMVVCPCSGSTLAAIAHSMGSNLIHRAAEVHLKERRKLVLVPRETPLSLPQIDNMRKATEAGAVVLPASPGFYHGPKSIDDLADFVVGRICDQLGVEKELIQRWGSRR
ncbi:MAG: UbiX family flavin prenyltransferase [Pirellulales bacterium]|nr:UbiX family flavin prenyltransferase [Pirellulales bacterium]